VMFARDLKPELPRYTARRRLCMGLMLISTSYPRRHVRRKDF
jgi:hypothetical protein